MATTIDTLQALCDSEIPFAIDTHVVARFSFQLGDERNEAVKYFSTRSFVDGVEWLARAAVEHFPDSDFAKSRQSKEQAGTLRKILERARAYTANEEPRY